MLSKNLRKSLLRQVADFQERYIIAAALDLLNESLKEPEKVFQEYGTYLRDAIETKNARS